MKRLLFSLVILSFIVACGHEKIIEPQDKVVDESMYTPEKVYEEYGCWPEDCNDIRRIVGILVDSSGYRYLFGSKEIDDKESFWVSKFTSSGYYIWEVINKNGRFAYGLTELKNGNLVVANVNSNSDYIDIYSIKPLLLFPEKGNVTEIKVKDNYIYSDIDCFDDFFFLSINQRSLELIPNSERWVYQIDNNGKILNSNEEMNIPSPNTIWLSETEFISVANEKEIVRGHIMNDPDWIFDPYFSSVYKAGKVTLTLDGEDIFVTYELQNANGSVEKREFRILLATGKEYVSVSEITLPETKGLVVGEEIALEPMFFPVDATVRNLTWESSEPSVATVDENGIVKGIVKGNSIITVLTEDRLVSASCTIKVSGVEDVTGIYFEEERKDLLRGKSYQLTAVIAPSTAVNKNIIWSSSAPDILSVDQNGVVTGHKRGSAAITAETEDGGYKATCGVRVLEITEFIHLEFVTSSLSIINGYVTGELFARFRNLSDETVHLTNLYVLDGLAPHYIIAMTDYDLLGYLRPGESRLLGARFRMVYYPIFYWEFWYEGELYGVQHQYGFTSWNFRSFNLNNKSSEMIKIQAK